MASSSHQQDSVGHSVYCSDEIEQYLNDASTRIVEVARAVVGDTHSYLLITVPNLDEPPRSFIVVDCENPNLVEAYPYMDEQVRLDTHNNIVNNLVPKPAGMYYVVLVSRSSSTTFRCASMVMGQQMSEQDFSERVCELVDGMSRVLDKIILEHLLKENDVDTVLAQLETLNLAEEQVEEFRVAYSKVVRKRWRGLRRVKYTQNLNGVYNAVK